MQCLLLTYCNVVITIYMNINTSTHVQMFLIFIGNIPLFLSMMINFKMGNCPVMVIVKSPVNV